MDKPHIVPFPLGLTDTQYNHLLDKAIAEGTTIEEILQSWVWHAMADPLGRPWPGYSEEHMLDVLYHPRDTLL